MGDVLAKLLGMRADAAVRTPIVVDASAMDTGHAGRGIGRYARELTDAMHDSRISFMRLNHGGVALRPHDWTLHQPNTTHLGRFAMNEVALGHVLEAQGCRLFHATEPWTLPHRVATVATVHDVIPLEFPKEYGGWDNAKWRVYFGYTRLTRRFEQCAHLIAISAYTRDQMVDRLGLNPDHISVVHHGVDHQKFRPASSADVSHVREKYELPQKFLLYLGGYDFRKNVPMLVEALGLARCHVPIVLVGKMSNEERYAVDAAARQGARVIYPGFVPDEDIPALYSAATAFVYPSMSEGFGLQVLEAMACGCPVVVSGAAALKEVAGDAALVIERWEPTVWGERIVELVRDEARLEELGRLAQTRAAEFSWERTARETVAVYERVL